MQLSTAAILSLLALCQSVFAFPRFDATVMKRSASQIKCQDKMPDGQPQKSRKFVLPPDLTDFSAQRRPDSAHPFQAPGPNDQRGPCPALNTLANHGYINRNGIVKSEDIITAVMEGLNMQHQFASFVVSYATMARGNANLAMLSIGFNDTAIPPLPNCEDGPVAGGIAKHGRFEGDCSDSRFDAHVGDSVNFQESLFQTVYPWVEKYGGLSPDGPNPTRNLLNIEAFGHAKYDTFVQFQKQDKSIEYHIDRQLTTFSEVAFVLELLAGDNNNTHTITLDRMHTFFRDQTFPKDFFRRGSPAGLKELSATAGAVKAFHPVPPGANDKDGNFVVDTPASSNFLCDGYTALVENNLWKGLNHQKGIFKENIDTMLEAVYAPFRDVANCTVKAIPKSDGESFENFSI